MNLNSDVRSQLMSLAGISDPADFDRMVRELAPQDAASGVSAGPTKERVGIGAPEMANLRSPFKLHFLKMVSLLESAPSAARLKELQGDAEGQIQHCFRVIAGDKDFADLGKLFKTSKPSISDEDMSASSKALRDRGNKLYAKKDMDGALSEYTKSILSGVSPRDAALGLGNRSAVLFESGAHGECLEDIGAALEHFAFPRELAHRLLARRGKCLAQLGRRREAGAALEEALTALEESSLKEERREEVRKEIRQIVDKLGDVKGSPRGPKDESAPDPQASPFALWDRHPNFPVLADSLSVAFSQEVGRHVLARKEIRAGEVLVIEDPVSAHLSPYKAKENCSLCFRRLGNRSLPSPLQPRRSRFCHPRCLRRALDSHHRVEARADITDIFYGDDGDSQLSGCISLAYRAVTQKSLNWFRSRRETLFSTHDIKFGVEVDKDYSYTGEEHYRGLFNLVTHLDRTSDTDRVTFLVRTIVLLRCLRASGYFPGVKEPFTKPEEEGRAGEKEEEEATVNYSSLELTEDELMMARLLFHFQAGIQYNLHAIYQVEGPLEAGKRIPLQDIGAGCYPTTLFFNHSCAPNTVRVNQGPRVIFLAKRNIRAGEEVTECYGIHHLNLSRGERRASLLQGYRFECGCGACRDDLPRLTDLPAQVPAQVALKLGAALARYKSLFEEGKLSKALQCCEDYLRRLEELGVRYPHRNYEVASLAMCSCLWGIAKDA